MDLNHRLAAGKKLTSFDLMLHKIEYPLTVIIPLGIVLLSLYTVGENFGEIWKTGNLSIIFVPIIGNSISNFWQAHMLIFSQIIVVGYALAPVSFYFFVKKVTGRHLPAIITAFMMLLPINIFSSEAPQRLQLALLERDGGHVTGLTITAWILLIFLKHVRDGSWIAFLLGLILSILLGLVSFFSVLLLLVFILFITISEMLISQGKIKFNRFLIFVFAILALLTVIYNISFLRMLVSDQGKVTIAVIANFLPLMFFIVPVLGTFAFLIFDRRPLLQPLFLSLFFAITFGLLYFVKIFFVESSIFNQNRYAAETNFAWAFLAGVTVMWVFDLLRSGILLKRFSHLLPFKTYFAYGFISLLFVIFLGTILFIPRSL